MNFMKFLPHVVSLDILSDKVPQGAVQLKGWHQARVLQHFPVIWDWLSLDCSTGKEPAQSRREWLGGKIFHGFVNLALLMDILKTYLHTI